MEQVNQYVYLLTSKSFTGYVKIGRSIRPQADLINYNVTTPLRDFEFLTVLKVDDYKKAKRRLVNVFNTVCASDTDWFKIDSDKAVKLTLETLR